jgi:hypothetical protein
MKRFLLFVGFVLNAALSYGQTAPHAEGGDSDVQFLGGGTASMSSDSGGSITPFAAVFGHFPLYFGSKSPVSLHVDALFRGLPGETVILSDVKTFKAVDLGVAVEHSLSSLAASTSLEIGLEGGFTTRLPGSPEPATKAAKRILALVKATDKAIGGEIALGYGYTEEAGVDPSMAIMVRAKLPIGASDSYFVLGGDAILPVSDAPNNYFTSQGRYRDVVRVYVAVDLGKTYKKLVGKS